MGTFQCSSQRGYIGSLGEGFAKDVTSKLEAVGEGHFRQLELKKRERSRVSAAQTENRKFSVTGEGVHKDRGSNSQRPGMASMQRVSYAILQSLAFIQRQGGATEGI